MDHIKKCSTFIGSRKNIAKMLVSLAAFSELFLGHRPLYEKVFKYLKIAVVGILKRITDVFLHKWYSK
jgi:hypothetical protein